MSRLYRTQPLEHLPVFQLLAKQGPSTAIELRQALHMTHEDVYAALIHLEATGAAAVRVTYTPIQDRVWVAA